MGILKDIYDIIKNDENALKLLNKETKKLLSKSSRKFFKKDLTVAEKRLLYSALAEELTDKKLSENFKDYFDYLTILLGLIVNAASSFDKGCLMRDFFSTNQRFYFFFPSPSSPLKLKQGADLSDRKSCDFKIVNTKSSFGFEEKYSFYAIESNSLNYNEMLKHCELMTRKGKNEKRGLLEYLREREVQYLELIGIRQTYDHSGYEFIHVTAPRSEELKLSFENPKKSKLIIREDLKKLVNFRLL